MSSGDNNLHVVASAPSNDCEAEKHLICRCFESPIGLDLFPITSTQKTNKNVLEIEKPLEEIEVSTALCLYGETWALSPKRVKNVESDNGSLVMEMKREIRLRECDKPHQKPQNMEDGRNKSGISTEHVLFDPWKIKKTLTRSDGNQYGLPIRVVLVQDNVILFLGLERTQEIESKNGLVVEVKDCDTNTVHNLILKKWKNSRTYVFIAGWKSNIVVRRNLKVGDTIGLFWNMSS